MKLMHVLSAFLIGSLISQTLVIADPVQDQSRASAGVSRAAADLNSAGVPADIQLLSTVKPNVKKLLIQQQDDAFAPVVIELTFDGSGELSNFKVAGMKSVSVLSEIQNISQKVSQNRDLILNMTGQNTDAAATQKFLGLIEPETNSLVQKIVTSLNQAPALKDPAVQVTVPGDALPANTAKPSAQASSTAKATTTAADPSSTLQTVLEHVNALSQGLPAPSQNTPISRKQWRILRWAQNLSVTGFKLSTVAAANRALTLFYYATTLGSWILTVATLATPPLFQMVGVSWSEALPGYEMALASALSFFVGRKTINLITKHFIRRTAEVAIALQDQKDKEAGSTDAEARARLESRKRPRVSPLSGVPCPDLLSRAIEFLKW